MAWRFRILNRKRAGSRWLSRIEASNGIAGRGAQEPVRLLEERARSAGRGARPRRFPLLGRRPDTEPFAPQVKLNSGVDYRGVLACLDGYMNIAMEQTEEVRGRATAPARDRTRHG